jgi:hypothetical protein
MPHLDNNKLSLIKDPSMKTLSHVPTPPLVTFEGIKCYVLNIEV